MAPPPKTGAILWLHDLAEQVPGQFRGVCGHHVPWLEIVTPAAMRRPVSCRDEENNVTPAWFDIAKLPLRSAAGPEDFDGLHDAIKTVHRRLDDLLVSMSIDSTRVVIAGIGQGGALAIAAGLAYPRALAGILSHSGFVCLAGSLAAAGDDDMPAFCDLGTCANHKTPIMMLHGTDDEMIDHSFASAGAARLRALGVSDVHFRSFNGVEHQMSKDSLNLAVDFFRGRLPADAPTAPKAGDAAAPPAAKSKTVIKMNRRSPGGGAAAAAPPAAVKPREDPPREEAPALEEDAPPPAEPVTAPPHPAPAKPASAAPPDVSDHDPSLSRDPATARALKAGDADALGRALERRGEDCPLEASEMMAIATLMLGEEETKGFAKGLSNGFADFPNLQQQQRQQQPPPQQQQKQQQPPLQKQQQKPPLPAAVAEEDSDDGEWSIEEVTPADETEKAASEKAPLAPENDGWRPPGSGGSGGSGDKANLTAAEWEAKAEEMLNRHKAQAAGAKAPAKAKPPAKTPTPAAATTKATAAAVPAAAAAEQAAAYELTDTGAGLKLVVPMPPAVTSMAQVDLAISATRCAISVDGAAHVDVALPRAVDEDQAAAKFAKKAGELRITAPWA